MDYGKSKLALEPQKSRLLARLGSRYQLRQRELCIADLRIAFTQVSDPDRVLDEVAAEEDRLQRIEGPPKQGDRLQLPYWAELWDSALGIGQLLVRHRDAWRGKSAIDLGCGMGLAGAVAARIGMKVLFADIEPAALLFAQLNSLPNAQSVRTRRLDWRSERLEERFDLIIGADILYERAQWDFLEPFWRAHVRLGGRVLLGEPGRQTGDLFLDWIQPRGWTVERFVEPVETRAAPIRLFELREK